MLKFMNKILIYFLKFTSSVIEILVITKIKTKTVLDFVMDQIILWNGLHFKPICSLKSIVIQWIAKKWIQTDMFPWPNSIQMVWYNISWAFISRTFIIVSNISYWFWKVHSFIFQNGLCEIQGQRALMKSYLSRFPPSYVVNLTPQ